MQQNNQVIDMTKGPTGRILIRFAVPMMIGNLFQQLYSVVDASVIGRFVGGDELGGIGATGSIHFLIFSVGYGIAASVGILVGMLVGAGEREKLTRAIYNSFYVMLGASLMITLVGFFGAEEALSWMKTPPENLPHAVTYLRVCLFGSAATIFYSGISQIVRAFGDSRTPLYILILACIINIGLDLLFVLVFHWAVFGVALATVLSQAIAAVLSFLAAWHYFEEFRYQRGAFQPDGTIIRRVLRLGMPMAGQNILISLSIMVLQISINGFGNLMVTAYTAIGQISNLIQQPYNSLSTAVSVFAAQNLGAGNTARIRKGLKLSLFYMLVITAAVVLAAAFFAVPLLSLFITDPAVMEIAEPALRIVSYFYVFLGVLYVVRGTLNGVGDAFFAGLNGVTECVCRFSMAHTLPRVPAWGKFGCFLCDCFTWLITAVISYLRFLQGKWDPERRKKRQNPEMICDDKV